MCVLLNAYTLKKMQSEREVSSRVPFASSYL
jgi:hypothetical protein